MAFMERIEPSVSDGERTVIRLLRRYGAMRDHEDNGYQLSSLVSLGRTMHIPPEGSVALASVFQSTEAVLGRCLITECCCARSMSCDERAILRLLAVRLPTTPGTGTPDIPHGLPGALAWAVLSVRRLCGNIIPLKTRLAFAGDAGCPFPLITTA